MQLFTTKQSTTYTFSGADADQRYARDDVGDELILRERDLHPLVPQSLQMNQDDMPEPTVPPNVPDDDDDQGNDFRSM